MHSRPITSRIFSEAERAEITTETLKVWRYTFLISGLEQPNVKMIEEITMDGSAKVCGVAEALSV